MIGAQTTKGKAMSQTLFLRRVLALDSLSCLALGLPMSLAAAPLAPLLGLDESLIRIAGLALVPLALFIFWLASRPAPPRLLVWAVIIGNIAWTAESFAVIAQQQPTPLGTAFVAAQALAVLGLSALEYAGLMKARVAA
jgi:hypothetical protein